MTWTLTLTPNDQDSLGALMASVEDEVARELRDAVLSIIARPVFERADQAQKMHKAFAGLEALRHEEWETTPTPKLAKGPKYHRPAKAGKVTRSDLLNLMTRMERKSTLPLDLKAATDSVNARRRERGELTISASTVRAALRALEAEGKVSLLRVGTGKASNRQAWAFATAGATCVEAGVGVRDA